MKNIRLELTDIEAEKLTVEMNVLLRDYGVSFTNDNMASAFNKLFLSLTGRNHENYVKYYPKELINYENNNKLIEELDFPIRAYNALKRSGINFVGELIALDRSDVFMIRNISSRDLEEVIQVLAEHGLKLKEE